MATPVLAVGLLDYFTPVFIFIFVFAIVFGILVKFDLFGKNNFLNSLVAFVMALLFLIMPTGTKLISFMTPWVIIFVILTFFVLLFLMFLGLKESSLESVGKHGAVITITISGIIILFIVALIKVYGGLAIHTGFWGEIFHPKTLGVVLLLIIASYVVRYVSKSS